MRRSAALLLVPVVTALLPARGGEGDEEVAAIEAAFETITEADLERHVNHLAAPELEGRDSPSAGLDRAAEYIESELRAAGLTGAGPGGSFRTTYRRRFSVPLPLSCSLVIEREDQEPRACVFGDDFVPLPRCEGEGVAEGAPVFLGFGISAARERYDDFRAGSFKGKVAVVLEGEPRHSKLFDGPEVITDSSDAYAKVGELERKGSWWARRPCTRCRQSTHLRGQRPSLHRRTG
jgi:hypothetical protein